MKAIALLEAPLPSRVWQAFQPLGEVESGYALSAKLVDTPVGRLVAITTRNALVFFDFLHRQMFDKQLARLAAAFPYPLAEQATDVHLALVGQLQKYFDGASAAFDLPLQPTGTEFEQALWAHLKTIPPGETRSYGQLAEALGLPNGARAVGRANGSNGLAIVIPCHRVIESSGGLGGYAGGLAAKRRLLQHERQHYAPAQPATLFG